jgi:hypothetical protein
VAVTAVPELWFSGLYFNSTILGLPFALGAFAVTAVKSRKATFISSRHLAWPSRVDAFRFYFGRSSFGGDRVDARSISNGIVTSCFWSGRCFGVALLAGLVDPIQGLEKITEFSR